MKNLITASAIALAAIAFSPSFAAAQTKPNATKIKVKKTVKRRVARKRTTRKTKRSTAPVTVSRRGVAATKEEALATQALWIGRKESACEIKGKLYQFKPAHNAGDAHPSGGFWTRAARSSCRRMSLSRALKLGLIREIR